jgi:hypothetical protein
MIKVTVGEQKTQSEKPFPKLMKSVPYGFIVLMKESGLGTVLFNGDSSKEVGYNSNLWIMDELIDYNEPITLQNA